MNEKREKILPLDFQTSFYFCIEKSFEVISFDENFHIFPEKKMLGNKLVKHEKWNKNI